MHDNGSQIQYQKSHCSELSGAMAYKSLNLKWTTKGSVRCHGRILQFLRENRAPVQTIEIRFAPNQTKPARQWEVDRNPTEIIDEILRFVALHGENVSVTIALRDDSLDR